VKMTMTIRIHASNIGIPPPSRHAYAVTQQGLRARPQALRIDVT
jgi:hypothetical protein